MAKPSFKIEWDAHEYEHKQRTEDWFWAVGIVVIAAAVASMIFGDIIFGILIIVAAFALSLFINRPPEAIHIIVDEKGVAKGNIRYPYEVVHSFSLDIEHSQPVLLLRSHRFFMPLIHIPLGENVDHNRLEQKLLEFIPTEFHGHRIPERFLEYLGF